MPQIYICEKCSKAHTNKTQYNAHLARKTPCSKSLTVQLLEQKIETPSFRQESLKLHDSLSKEDRKNEGIFFTPKKARDLLFEKLKEFGVDPSVILEPSFGSGEFMIDLREKYPKSQIYGVEKNKTIFDSFSKNSKEHISNVDFLNYKECKNADLIVGNPPYFVIKEKNPYPKCMTGRPNIYVAFLYKCITEHLKENGILAFVIPTSLLNCGYYQPMRNYIAKNMTIKYIQELDVKYYQTGQDTMLFIVEKNKEINKEKEKDDKIKKDYIYTINNKIFISPKWNELNELLQGTKSLKSLDFVVKTGDVVWNAEKDKMVNESEKGRVLLIYNSNIKNGEIIIGNINIVENKKTQYIKGFKKEPSHGPAILVNRGNGTSSYKFNYAFVPETFGKFYAENHVNVISPTSENAKKMSPKIIESFKNPKTELFFRWFVGNGAFSKTELETILPIFL